MEKLNHHPATCGRSSTNLNGRTRAKRLARKTLCFYDMMGHCIRDTLITNS